MQKEGLLLLYQVDHLSGEEIGTLVDATYDRGARAVHIVPTFTKKNRPGLLVLIDATDVDEAALATVLAARFGLSGHHRIETTHCYERTAEATGTLVVRWNGRTVTLPLPLKIVGDPAAPLLVRPESDGLTATHRHLCDEIGCDLSLIDLRRSITALLSHGTVVELEIDPVSRQIK